VIVVMLLGRYNLQTGEKACFAYINLMLRKDREMNDLMVFMIDSADLDGFPFMLLATCDN